MASLFGCSVFEHFFVAAAEVVCTLASLLACALVAGEAVELVGEAIEAAFVLGGVWRCVGIDAWCRSLARVLTSAGAGGALAGWVFLRAGLW